MDPRPHQPTPPAPARRRPALLGAVVRPLQAFFELEAASGVVLLACAVAALAWVNLGGAPAYEAALGYVIDLSPVAPAVGFTVHALVNDGLMTVFFFLVGMEIKRELAVGELSTPARAALPAIAAVGGMVVPAAIYVLFNRGGPGRSGWGIPMATDIAFCIACLTLLRRYVPRALLVFVTALAIFDDIGGILVIALFYGSGLSAGWLAVAVASAAALVALSRRGVAFRAAYLVAGAILWYALHRGGVHPTVAGVVTGLAIPPAPLERLVRALHPWVAFGVMPVFALANSGVHLAGVGLAQALGPVATGAGLGLLAGKTCGVFAFTWVATRLGVAPIPGGASAAKLLGVSIVAGIGFTVALFIAGLAFPRDPGLLDQAKIGIIGGSLLAGLAGALVLRATAPVAENGACAAAGRDGLADGP